MKTQRNGGPSQSFPFRKHFLGQYTAGSPGGIKSISLAINQEQQMAYCSPDFFNLQAPNKLLVMEDNKIKMKPWGNNTNHTLRLYVFLVFQSHYPLYKGNYWIMRKETCSVPLFPKQ